MKENDEWLVISLFGRKPCNKPCTVVINPVTNPVINPVTLY